MASRQRSAQESVGSSFSAIWPRPRQQGPQNFVARRVRGSCRVCKHSQGRKAEGGSFMIVPHVTFLECTKHLEHTHTHTNNRALKLLQPEVKGCLGTMGAVCGWCFPTHPLPSTSSRWSFHSPVNLSVHHGDGPDWPHGRRLWRGPLRHSPNTRSWLRNDRIVEVNWWPLHRPWPNRRPSLFVRSKQRGTPCGR